MSSSIRQQEQTISSSSMENNKLCPDLVNNTIQQPVLFSTVATITANHFIQECEKINIEYNKLHTRQLMLKRQVDYYFGYTTIEKVSVKMLKTKAARTAARAKLLFAQYFFRKWQNIKAERNILHAKELELNRQIDFHFGYLWDITNFNIHKK